ncbi:MAG TPA: hypothetical protein PLB96_13515 [Syntrophales bacterium]|nr:hypothetical protein [Syntrophales bacterium]
MLLEKHREFYRRFYLGPRTISRYILSFLSATGWRRALSVLKSLPFVFGRQSNR